MTKKIAEFELRRDRLIWLSVETHDAGEQARLLDVVEAIERRELEEAGENTLRLAVTA